MTDQPGDDEKQADIMAALNAQEMQQALRKLSPFENPAAWRKTFTALAAEQAPLALASCIELLQSRDPMARIMAARMILEYGMGKPVSADKHDAVNHKVIDARGAQTVRWSTPEEATDAALSRAADDAPISLQPLVAPAAPIMSPDAKPAPAVVDQPDDLPDDDGTIEQPGALAPLPIVDVAKMFGEERGIATDAAAPEKDQD